MKNLKLSGFDLGIIIAFAVVTLLGGGAWWYLSGQLQATVDKVSAAKSDFDKYSKQGNVVVSSSNEGVLKADIDLLKAQLNPLISAKLLPKENTLHSIGKEDPVEWKHDLDDEVRRLNAAAKVHSVVVPPNYYFSFSRYLNQSPSDEQTAVLSKQLVGVEQLATILINAPVKGIQAIRRTYEEDGRPGAGSAFTAPTTDPDQLAGYSVHAAGNTYTAYPFEVEFETSSEDLRTVMDSLIQSHYLFVVRTLSVQSSRLNSPGMSDLDKLAEPPDASVVATSPGEVAATTPTKGPQKLFGYSILKVKARIDLIEWNAELSEATSGSAPNESSQNPLLPGGK